MTGQDAALRWYVKADDALSLSMAMRAKANAVYAVPDTDDLAGDVRNEVYHHLSKAADAYYELHKSYRERARDCLSQQDIRYERLRRQFDDQAARRARYDDADAAFEWCGTFTLHGAHDGCRGLGQAEDGAA